MDEWKKNRQVRYVPTDRQTDGRREEALPRGVCKKITN